MRHFLFSQLQPYNLSIRPCTRQVGASPLLSQMSGTCVGPLALSVKREAKCGQRRYVASKGVAGQVVSGECAISTINNRINNRILRGHESIPEGGGWLILRERGKLLVDTDWLTMRRYRSMPIDMAWRIGRGSVLSKPGVALAKVRLLIISHHKRVRLSWHGPVSSAILEIARDHYMLLTMCLSVEEAIQPQQMYSACVGDIIPRCE